ncbi:hypothetical protein HOLleu_05753 [Holothuria leucospilota]|uniref:Uncharacterized protein n=1 Tax=Holothuria leucospilota TaxID=206669 RepID=A0A9Q1CL62_HOLLE|nr:hypothetical protein HOLleu_05753 [Holothuria leucospilota]
MLSPIWSRTPTVFLFCFLYVLDHIFFRSIFPIPLSASGLSGLQVAASARLATCRANPGPIPGTQNLEVAYRMILEEIFFSFFGRLPKDRALPIVLQ